MFPLGPCSLPSGIKGSWRGGEVPGERVKVFIRDLPGSLYGTVTSRQLLQNPDDRTVHSEGAVITEFQLAGAGCDPRSFPTSSRLYFTMRKLKSATEMTSF